MSSPGQPGATEASSLLCAWLGLREGGVVGRGVQVIWGSLPFSQRGSGTLGENGGMLAHVGVFVSPQGLLGWCSSSQGPGHLSEDHSVLWASWVLSGWSFLFAPQPGLRRPRKMQSEPLVLDPVDGAAWI